MIVSKGVCLGPYEIVSHLGSGGMGEVWRARDNRIRRDVAVKVLPQTFAPDDERMQRFEQEARAAGALNHPGLVTIFDVGNVDGMPYLVMELLEGQTLREAIDDAGPGGLPPRKAIEIATQIALALAVAHGHGIIHRDLKPENIFITADRRVKILDFGLAKLATEAKDVDGRHQTLRQLTSAGLVVGTPGYMSPEQVRAAPLDHRTDIFSLGSVLYEMLTGGPAFAGQSAVETMHAVLTDDPKPLDALVSPALDETVRHCLEKDPRERFQSARDLAFHLRTLPEIQRSLTGEREVAQPRRPVAFRAGIVALTLLLAMAAGGFVWRGFHTAAAPMARSYAQLTSADGQEILPSFAPDGKSFAYVSDQRGNRDIYVQRVDGRTAVDITADCAEDDSEPAFSPDGSKIAFRSERDGGGIFIMSATGESPLRLTNFGHNPTWSPDATQIAFATEAVEMVPNSRPRLSELWAIDVRSGALRPLVQARKGGPDFGSDSDAVQPSWSPHGKRIAFWGISISGQRDIWTIDPHAPEPKRTALRLKTDTALHWNPVWSPDGKYLYYGSDRDGAFDLWRVAIDENSGAAAGAPELVGLPAWFTGNFAFAKSGEMLFVAAASSYRVLAMPFDLNAGTIGPAKQLFAGSQQLPAYEPSPDGKMIAYTTGGAREDLFVTDGTHLTQLTNDVANDRGVQWASDSKTLYFYSNRGGTAYHIWSIRADGSDLKPVTDDADAKSVGARMLHTPVPAPDGQTLLVQTLPANGTAPTNRKQSALVHLDRHGGQRVELLHTLLLNARWSPDGQFIVSRDPPIQENRRGTPSETPGPIVLYSLRTRRAETLSKSGLSPHWTRDGKKIVYFEQQGIRILDLQSRAVKTVPLPSLVGTSWQFTSNERLSSDTTTIYVQQTSRQSDIWMAHFPNS